MLFQEFAESKTGFKPYKYQLAVNDILQSGKNLILSVPTGAGKTWASILPFLYARENNLNFPKKLIYSLPLRALANSIFKDVKKVVEDSKIQTGEFSEDTFFESDIVFSTIDQTLSNFLCFPLALSPKQANINAGAMIGSYLVFDEFHLLDNSLSMATTLGMLRRLESLSRFCIMTATLSDEMTDSLKKNLPNCVVLKLDDFQEDIPIIKSLIPAKNKKKIKVYDNKINAENIWEKHKERTIVICNRIETAQRVYTELYELTKGGKIEIICLHSRFFDSDRKTKEEKLKKLFGKDSQANAILISTSVVEAGMDISCQVLHTEISPINSFLQRAGRCARFENEIGEIFIYDILDLVESEKINIETPNAEDKKEIAKLNKKYLPYESALCQSSLKVLKEYDNLDSPKPEEMVNRVLKDYEIEQFKTMEQSDFNREKIKAAWEECTKNHYRDTIRDIQNVEIVLVNASNTEGVNRIPYAFETVGIFKWTLVAWLKQRAEESDFDKEENWLVKQLEPNNQFGEEGDEPDYVLKKVSDFATIKPLIFLNAEFFGYSSQIGFNNFHRPFNTPSPKKPFKEKDKNEEHRLKKDTFRQHNLALMGCFEKEFLPKLNFIASLWKEHLAIPDLDSKQVERVIRLMILLHDYGKLNDGWQKPMQDYQTKRQGYPCTEPLGHTDFIIGDKNDEELGKLCKLNTRPAHAGVGAYAIIDVLIEMFDNEDLANTVALAICRHHGATTVKIPAFEIPLSNYTFLDELLKSYEFSCKLKKKGRAGEVDHLSYQEFELFYLFLVRILRLCDQKATEDFQKYQP